MFLPHIQALTIEAKLSSINIISAACLATSVPAMPIANPTFALFKAGASLVPSPVTATISPISYKPVTNKYLSSGLDLANTLSFFQIFLNSSIFLTPSFTFFLSHLQGESYLQVLQYRPPILLKNSGPVIITSSLSSCLTLVIILHSLAIAVAVNLLSPVTILTVIPAFWQRATASGTSFLMISLIPMIVIKVNPVFSTTAISSFSVSVY
jgi:hypothetical protein